MKHLISLVLGMIAVLWFFLQDFWYFKDVCEKYVHTDAMKKNPVGQKEKVGQSREARSSRS